MDNQLNLDIQNTSQNIGLDLAFNSDCLVRKIVKVKSADLSS